MTDLELPPLPSRDVLSTSIIPPDQFSKKTLKSLIHIITGQLKAVGTKTPHILLPYRSKVDDNKLEIFLMKIFPQGELVEDSVIQNVVKKTDEFTLMASLKYIWCRMPGGEIIGWDVYLEFKRKEEQRDYPKTAFLEIMPKCLSSPAHASIVYDFLDLLINIASHSKHNLMSGRKIAKMASLWAFNGPSTHNFENFDATLDRQEKTFVDGLNDWKASADAVFHLFLSFLRAMLPQEKQDKLNLPKALQSLIATHSYPPTDSDAKRAISIPLVTIKTSQRSFNPLQLLSKVRTSLSFESKDSFVSVEDYTILKSIFKKEKDSEVIASLTVESKRILSRLTETPSIESEYDLYPGWPRLPPSDSVYKSLDTNNMLCSATVDSISIQDYYIWAWLSSIASDQDLQMKQKFGRTLIVEADVTGFQKWLIIQERFINLEDFSTEEMLLARHNDYTVKELPPIKIISEEESLAESVEASNPGIMKSSPKRSMLDVVERSPPKTKTSPKRSMLDVGSPPKQRQVPRKNKYDSLPPPPPPKKSDNFELPPINFEPDENRFTMGFNEEEFDNYNSYGDRDISNGMKRVSLNDIGNTSIPERPPLPSKDSYLVNHPHQYHHPPLPKQTQKKELPRRKMPVGESAGYNPIPSQTDYSPMNGTGARKVTENKPMEPDYPRTNPPAQPGLVAQYNYEPLPAVDTTIQHNPQINEQIPYQDPTNGHAKPAPVMPQYRSMIPADIDTETAQSSRHKSNSPKRLSPHRQSPPKQTQPQQTYIEPYEAYPDPIPSAKEPSDEPFDDYVIPGINGKKDKMSRKPQQNPAFNPAVIPPAASRKYPENDYFELPSPQDFKSSTGANSASASESQYSEPHSLASPPELVPQPVHKYQQENPYAIESPTDKPLPVNYPPPVEVVKTKPRKSKSRSPQHRQPQPDSSYGAIGQGQYPEQYPQEPYQPQQAPQRNPIPLQQEPYLQQVAPQEQYILPHQHSVPKEELYQSSPQQEQYAEEVEYQEYPQDNYTPYQEPVPPTPQSYQEQYPPQGYPPAPPQQYLPTPHQGYPPAPPQQYPPAPPQGYTPAPPQQPNYQHRPAGPQQQYPPQGEYQPHYPTKQHLSPPRDGQAHYSRNSSHSPTHHPQYGPPQVPQGPSRGRPHGGPYQGQHFSSTPAGIPNNGYNGQFAAQTEPRAQSFSGNQGSRMSNPGYGYQKSPPHQTQYHPQQYPPQQQGGNRKSWTGMPPSNQYGGQSPNPHIGGPVPMSKSDATVAQMLPAQKFNKNAKGNKAHLRAAFAQGNFGI